MKKFHGKHLIRKVLLAVSLMAATSWCAAPAVDAASREEVAAIEVHTAADFQYWNEGAPALAALTEFVENAVNPDSEGFIPEEARIATFDLDGTLYCETAPYYFQEMMFLHRVLEDKTYKPTAEMIEIAETVKPYIMGKKSIPSEDNARLLKILPKAYEGMTQPQYKAYVKRFMQTNEIGLTNLKRGEAFYLPMVEVVSYLNNNGFTVYLNSACEREILRALAEDILGIPLNRMIGSNVAYTTTNMGDETGIKHTYDRFNEKVVRTDNFLGENGKTNKVFSNYVEIGRQPVLSFGNSSGDSGMMEYTLQNNPYPSIAFFVLCDDTERELGNLDKAAKLKTNAIERGWTTISMHDDFATIYGDDVVVDR